MCKEEDNGVRPVRRPREWRELERLLEKDLKSQNWHRGEGGQVSAPLIVDPTSGNMLTELKKECKKFEDLTGIRVVVMERAESTIKHLAKSEPLKSKGCGWDNCFPCSSKSSKCEKTERDTVSAARPASWLEGRPFTMERQGRMVSPEENNIKMPSG